MAVHGSLAPGLSYETYDTSPGGIAAIRTDVAGFVGIAERGPMGTPVRVESWVQFQSMFGGLIGVLSRFADWVTDWERQEYLELF